MKKLVLAGALILALAPLAEGKILKAYNGDVDFDHSKHMGMFECKSCHDGPPKPFGINKEIAHKLCIGCHKKEGAGPVRHCSECHTGKHD
jgi:hypothetical protein